MSTSETAPNAAPEQPATSTFSFQSLTALPTSVIGAVADNVQKFVTPAEVTSEVADPGDAYVGVPSEEVADAAGIEVTPDAETSSPDVTLEPKGASSMSEFWESVMRGEAPPAVSIRFRFELMNNGGYFCLKQHTNP